MRKHYFNCLKTSTSCRKWTICEIRKTRFEFCVSTCYAYRTMEMSVKHTISKGENTNSTGYKLVRLVESGDFV